jgi:hypothetical protein
MSIRPDTYFKLPLLPHSLRYVGYLLILFSLGAAYLYFLGGRPAFFEVPVFAIITSYAETRWLVFAQTNALDEIAVIFALAGLLIILFSKESIESEDLSFLRMKAIVYGIYSTSILLAFIYLTVFGWPVFISIAFSYLLFLVVSFLIFKILVHLKKSVSIKSKSKKESYDT